MELTPFHLAVQVREIDEARDFYGVKMGFQLFPLFFYLKNAEIQSFFHNFFVKIQSFFISMERKAEKYLVEWSKRKNRKPLIIKGARQVGKTYLVDDFAQKHFETYVKVDFEYDLAVRKFFRDPSPQMILEELSLHFDCEIQDQKTLLFLDEIQACPEALTSLRYFYEKKPGLHVIAAGSLLDFHLREFSYSIPVGRLEYLYLYPLTFEEYLLAQSQQRLLDVLSQWVPDESFPEAAHNKLLAFLREYFFLGGMPEAVADYLENRSLPQIQRIHSPIVTSVRDDFAKYGTRKEQDHLRRVLDYVPRNIGKKVKYVNIDREIRSVAFKEAFRLLQWSRVVSLIKESKGNGVPLDAESSEKGLKSILLDIGLVNHLCGLKLTEPSQLITVNEGALAEQFIGQELLAGGEFFQENSLFYWNREEKNSNSELDYLMEFQNLVVPIEVKAGKTGILRSLHRFLYEKNLTFGVRFNIDRPSLTDSDVSIRVSQKQEFLQYRLLSLPLYFTNQIHRILSYCLT